MRTVFALVAAVAAAAPAIAAGPATDSLHFAITRNGDQIGTYSIEVTRSGPDTSVAISTDLAVKVLFVTAYHLQHTANERWTNGRLVSFSSTTDNNGTRHKVSVVQKAPGFDVDADGKTSHVDPSVLPASLWNPEVLRHTSMLDPQEGQVLPLAVVDVGVEPLDIDGHPVRAHHYTMKSKYSQDVWYDDQHRLVQARFVGSDGSVILYKPM